MSSIQPIGSSPLMVSGPETTSPASGGILQGTLDGVASTLGMSTSDLRSALKSGSSIADLAAKQGVSVSSVVQSIEQQVQQQRAANGQPPLGQTTLDQAVNNAVQHHRGHHHHRHGGAAAATTLDALTPTSASSVTGDPNSTDSSSGSSLDLFA